MFKISPVSESHVAKAGPELSTKAKAGFEFLMLLLSTSQILELHVCTTIPANNDIWTTLNYGFCLYGR